MPFVWLVIIIIAAVIEGLTVQLVSVWFAVSGIVAAVAAFFGAAPWIQVLLFLAVSAVLLLCTRPFARRMTRFQKVQTNADRYVGKTGIVTEEICNTDDRGLVKIMGSVWTARSEDDSIIPAGSIVAVARIEGVKLIVRRN
ncbi:NfeD family protein [Caproicibacterium lactatifermentans]|uniref:NfeD family protein n=2 Tax=Oscillospiraceae TaxID=216572 RepID=A0A859DSR3_9FIRM|nr:NfeD family protein [Caproicibacterium lactatifermentans]QKO31157.1 NfeD family protein [Caproicibacterium lactatifermentans]